jgi:phage I-like protein
MLKPATRNADRVVLVQKSRQAGLGLALALANRATPVEVAFGDGLEIALARSGDQVTAPEWVQVFPAGPVIEARDGRKWTLPNPQLVVAAFAANRADLPFDIEHATEKLAPEGKEAPAQGWIKGLQARADGTVWAQVDWTSEGADHVVKKRYRYVSPAFEHTKEGAIVRVTSAALTTHPALRMPALAGDGRRTPRNQQDDKMTTIALATAAAALGLAATASESDVVTAMTAGAQAAKDVKDPTKFVPKADLDAALTRATNAETALATVQKGQATAKATAAVEAAIAEGKITPASKDHWISIAQETPDAFEKAMASMPKIAGQTTATEKRVDGADADANGLTADQKALCASLGLEEKAYATTLKETAR